MADVEQCPLQLAIQLLHIKTLHKNPITVLTALDDYYYVPRHAPYVEQSQLRVVQAVAEFETQRTLPAWVHQAVKFLSQDPHLSHYHHSIE